MNSEQQKVEIEKEEIKDDGSMVLEESKEKI